MNILKDYSTLTDDQLYEKLQKAYSYKSMQSSLGHTVTVHSIDSVIDALEAEKIRRMESDDGSFGKSKKLKKKMKDEMDKQELAPITFGKLDTEI